MIQYHCYLSQNWVNYYDLKYNLIDGFVGERTFLTIKQKDWAKSRLGVVEREQKMIQGARSTNLHNFFGIQYFSITSQTSYLCHRNQQDNSDNRTNLSRSNCTTHKLNKENSYSLFSICTSGVKKIKAGHVLIRFQCVKVFYQSRGLENDRRQFYLFNSW